MLMTKEGQDLQRLITNNLIKYFEKPVRHAPDYDEAAIRDSVTHYFGGKGAVGDSSGRVTLNNL